MSLVCATDGRDLCPLEGWRSFRTIDEAVAAFPGREGLMVRPVISVSPFAPVNGKEWSAELPQSVRVSVRCSRTASFAALEAVFGRTPFEMAYRALAGHFFYERPNKERAERLGHRYTKAELNGVLVQDVHDDKAYDIYGEACDAISDRKCIVCGCDLTVIPPEEPYFVCTVIDPLEIVYNQSMTGSYQWSRLTETSVHFHLCHGCLKQLPGTHDCLASDLAFPGLPYKYGEAKRLIQETMAQFKRGE